MFGKKPAQARGAKGAVAAHAAGVARDDAPTRPRLADAAGGLLSLIVLLRRTPDLDRLRDLRMTVERLIAAGHVKRRPDPEHGRRQILTLTAKGERAYEAVATAARRRNDALPCLIPLPTRSVGCAAA